MYITEESKLTGLWVVWARAKGPTALSDARDLEFQNVMMWDFM